MAGHTLFGGQRSLETFNHYLGEIKKEINTKSNDYILNVDVEEFKKYFTEKYDYTPLTVYTDKTTVAFKSKGKKMIEDYGRKYEIDTYTFELKVPFTGWSFLFHLTPSTFRMANVYADTPQSESGFITVPFTLHEQNERVFENEKQKIIGFINANVPNINRDLTTFKANVINTFTITYSQKKAKGIIGKFIF